MANFRIYYFELKFWPWIPQFLFVSFCYYLIHLIDWNNFFSVANQEARQVESIFQYLSNFLLDEIQFLIKFKICIFFSCFIKFSSTVKL